MNFDFTDEQIQLCADIKKFAERELGEDRLSRNACEEPIEEARWRADWKKCGQYGVFGLNVAPEYGGLGLDTLSTALAMESLGYGCQDNGLTLAINGQVWAVEHPIAAFGSHEQKQQYLAPLASGALVGAHGLTEAASGSDAMSLETTAVKRDGGYVLNGRKVLVGMGPACDVALVFASTRPEHKNWGLSVFLVEVDDPGFTRGEPELKMGLQSVPTGDLILKDCWVPDDRLLGPEGAGASIFQATMEWERSFIFTSHVGAMARQLDECVAFARNRNVFSQPIIGYQSVSNRLADMKVRLETSRLLVYRTACRKDAGESIMADAAVTKLHVSEALVASGLDAIRIHGGTGYLANSGIEHHLRDAVGGVIYSGTSDIQREIIAGLLR